MVYERYEKRNGKLYGPYYYESYREGNKIKKRYLGQELPKSSSTHLWSFLLLAFLGALIAFVVAGYSYHSPSGNTLFSEVGDFYKSVFQDSVFVGRAGLGLNSLSESGASDSSDVSDSSGGVEESQNLGSNAPPSEEQQEIPAEIPTGETPSPTQEAGDMESGQEQVNESEGQEIIINETEIPAANETISNETLANETILNETISNETIANETISNETLVNETIVEEQNVSANITIKTSREGRIVLGKPVKWTKNITLDEPAENVTIELPASAENIEVTKVEDGQETSARATISGVVVAETKGFNLFEWLANWLNKFFLSLTGRAIDDGAETIEVSLEDNATEYTINYETPAPTADETLTANGKQIVIFGPDELNYTDVLAYTYLAKEAKSEDVKFYHLVNGTKEIVSTDVYDENENGLVDYIEWNVPHLSNQTYLLIIEISKAEHLDVNRTFISDIYDYVKAQDGNWSEQINNGEYVRVTFEHELDNTRDITVYARSACNNSVRINDTDVPCEVYYKKLRLEELRRAHG